jgi:hypothetical protein
MRSNDPAVNWLAHVLTENVGRVEWIRMTAEEQAEYDSRVPVNAGYPFKVVRHPIPDGLDLVINDSKEYIIGCNNAEIRDMLVGLAERYEHYLREFHRLSVDSKPWRPASEAPDGPASSIRRRLVQVDSGPLRYVSPFSYGFHDRELNKWFVVLGEQLVEHAVEQWRHLPIAPNECPKYEQVKDEVERLRVFINRDEV